MNTSKNHDNIDEIYKKIWDCLKLGIKESKSDYHTFSFATIRSIVPNIRTVVLRSFDDKENKISFHTDRRSPKLNEINSNDNVSALFYDKSRKIQLRIIGKALATEDSIILKDIWASMRPESKLCYMGPFKPSQKLDGFKPNLPIHDAQNISDNSDDYGYNNFCKVSIEIKSLEWLKLHHKGHQRIYYQFKPKAKPQWIAS